MKQDAIDEWSDPTMFIGIDPGKSGGIAFLYRDGRVRFCSAMPKTERDVWDEIYSCVHESTTIKAFIERVHSMPKQGVASSFTFGQNYGFLRGCLTASNVYWEDVTPQAWQKAIGCLSRGDKNVTKAKAQQLFPTQKVTHATADALLIAEYGRRTWLQREGKGKEPRIGALALVRP